jgi:hypothetical protein
MRELSKGEMSQVSGGHWLDQPDFTKPMNEWTPMQCLEAMGLVQSFDDSGSRYYDSQLGEGTVSSDGKTWKDANGKVHLTSWYQNQVDNIDINWAGVLYDLSVVGLSSIGGAGPGIRTVAGIFGGVLGEMNPYQPKD